MRWIDLLNLVKNWEKLQHVSLNDPVEVNINGEIYPVDLVESLHTGKAIFIAVGGEEDGVE